MVAFDPIAGRPIGWYLGTSESVEEITDFLKIMKKRIIKDPKYCTVDFDPAWKKAIKNIFPKTIIIICTFHAHQLLTRALLKELNRLQKVRNTYTIKEYQKIRKISLDFSNYSLDKISQLRLSKFSKKWLEFSFKLDELGLFYFNQAVPLFNKFLDDLKAWDFEIFNELNEKLIKILPRKGLTKKNYRNIFKKCSGFMRSILKSRRTKFENDKKEFARIKFLLLKKPKNMSEFERDLLNDYLKNDIELYKIRKILLKYYNLFEDDNLESYSLNFLKDLITKDSHNYLKAAIKTLIENEEYIFNYQKFRKQYPKYAKLKSIRVNPEFMMRAANQVAKTQYGFRSVEGICKKIGGYFKCPVFVSEKVKT